MAWVLDSALSGTWRQEVAEHLLYKNFPTSLSALCRRLDFSALILGPVTDF